MIKIDNEFYFKADKDSPNYAIIFCASNKKYYICEKRQDKAWHYIFSKKCIYYYYGVTTIANFSGFGRSQKWKPGQTGNEILGYINE